MGWDGMGDKGAGVSMCYTSRRASPSEREDAVDLTMRERARAKNGGSARMDGACGAGGFLRNWIGAEDDGGAVDGDVGVSSERRTNHRFGGVCVGVSDVVGGEEIKG